MWAARDERTGRDVALKLLRAPVSETAGRRLAREIDANGRLAHDAICRMWSALPADAGLVLERLSGPSLAEHLEEEGALDPRRALPIFGMLFPALDAIRAAGIVHRDVCPANIVLDGPQRAKLIDFGMAKIVDDSMTPGAVITSDDAALGSLVYAAPEQVHDPRTADARADLYGLGACLFTALAGRPPLRAPTIATLLALKSHRDAPALAEVTSRRWPEELEAIVAALLARDPARRPASGVAVAERLLPLVERM